MKSLLFLAGACLLLSAKAQQFQNLDFELGKTPTGYDSVNTTPTERQILLPSWITYYRSDEGIEEDLNRPYAMPLLTRGDSICIGAPCIWIGASYALHGKYGVSLDAGGGGLSRGETGIRQKGLLAANAKSLKLLASGDEVFVRIGETELPSLVEAGAVRGVVLSFDVTPFAGQIVDLTVATRSTALVDNLSFSTNPPMPVSPALAFTGPFPDGRILLTWSGHLQQATESTGPFVDVGAAVNGSGNVWLYEPFQKQPALFFRVRN